MIAKKRTAKTTLPIEKASAKKTVRAVAKKVAKKGSAATDTDAFTAFRPAALTFFRGLKRNNRKEWFEKHRDDFEREVKRPLLALIEEVDARLAEFVPEIIGSPKKSMFRIYRDVRFSKDKSPYKTHAAAWFYHRDGGSSVGSEAAHGGAGFYFHLSPEGSHIGGGIWMPPRPVLNRIRLLIAENPDGFESIVGAPAFRRKFGALETELMLTRVPRGFDPNHKAAPWLRLQSFTAGHPLTNEQLLSPKLPQTLANSFEIMTPFVRWLNSASGLRQSSMR
ncbi:MAG: DUF2461 domain-containing protein [Gemmatimonadota bacterium]|nr:DUF2461 domain-containing protein [Gemmatimonadota bacterium]